MDRRETFYDPFAGTFDQSTMTGQLDGEGEPVRCHFVVCPVCDGRGSHVNPAVDSHGLSADDFADDPDFAESYFAGVYDVRCAGCAGRRVVPEPDDESDREHAREAQREHVEYLAEIAAERRVGA